MLVYLRGAYDLFEFEFDAGGDGEGGVRVGTYGDVLECEDGLEGCDSSMVICWVS